MVFFTAAAATFLASALGASAAPGLSLKISGPAQVAHVDNLSVVTTLVNTGDETLKLFNDPRTPLSSFPSKTFSIQTVDGKAAPKFTGAKVKYGFESALKLNDAKAFTVLAPGQSIDVTHDLSKTYNFNSSGAGKYAFEAVNLFHYVADSATGKIDSIYASVLDAHTVDISGTLVPTKTGPNKVKRASFVGCTSSQSTSINTALTTTTTYVNNAYTYLTGISSGTTRYTTWFGTYSASRKSTVQSHYNNIKNNSPTTYTYDCTCTDSAYAYVFPDQFGYIYLCNAFWTAPTTGTDSKAGTIVHESSHFTLNGGTDDYAYGQAACKSLAISNPDNAVFNADSHEYFAENNPALS